MVDLRNRKFEEQSDCCESELTCLAVAKVCSHTRSLLLRRAAMSIVCC